MKTHILTIFLLILLFSCQYNNPTNPVRSIDISSGINSDSTTTLQELFPKIEITKIDSVGDLEVLAYQKDTILVRTRHGYNLITNSSQHLKRVGQRGPGEGEYSYSSSATAIHNSYFVLNSPASEEVLEFDHHNNLQRTIKSEVKSIQMNVFKDNLLFVPYYSQFSNKDNARFKLASYNLATGEVKKHGYTTKENWLDIPSQNNTMLYAQGHDLYYKETTSDTLFVINDDLNFHPFLVFNQGPFKMPTSVRQDLNRKYKEGLRYIDELFVQKISNYLFIKCNNGEDIFYMVYDLSTDTFIHKSVQNKNNPEFSGIAFNDASNSPYFWPELVNKAPENTAVFYSKKSYYLDCTEELREGEDGLSTVFTVRSTQ